jgi:hypothetical protein
MDGSIRIATAHERRREAPRVAIVGGLERLERQLVAMGTELGVDVEVHNGHTWGGGAARLTSLVQRTSLVVIVTGTNSHNAVHIARREAVRVGVPVRIVKFLGARTARALLHEVAQAAAA